MASDSHLSDLAQKTLQRINDALDDGAVAGVPEVIRLIQELSTKAFSISIVELADLISQDVAVTAKVLSAANTISYNPTGSQVNTISQAIQVIGFERVRNLAISLLLAENAERTLSIDEQREVSAFALSSGLLAQTLMQEYGTADPEQTFVCTALRNYGRLLMTAFLIEDYRVAQDRSSVQGEDAAFREMFGLTPLELSYHLLQSANLPKEILSALRGYAPHISEDSILRPEEQVIVFSNLAVRICELATDGGLTPEDFRSEALAILGSYGKRLALDGDKLEKVLQTTMQKVRGFAHSFGVKTVATGTARLIDVRAGGRKPPPDLAGFKFSVRRKPPKAADVAPPPVDDLAASAPTAGPTPEQRIIAANEAMGALLRRGPTAYRKVDAVALLTLREALVLSDVFLFDLDEDGTYELTGGIGALFNSVRGQSDLISKERRDVFGVSLIRGEDVLIEDARNPKISRYLPEWMQTGAPVQSLILLPVLERRVATAMLAGVRVNGPGLQVDQGTLQALKQMRPLLAQARSKD